MSLLPVVHSARVETASVSLTLAVPSSLDYFPGHFPNLPILPGVVQVDWVTRLAREHLGISCTGFSALRTLKFSAPVLPDTTLTLQITWVPEKQRLDFGYRAGQRLVSSGQIAFVADAAA